MKSLENRPCIGLESLEGRRLMSASVAEDILTIETPSFTFTTQAAATFTITKVKGEYDGHYTSTDNPEVGKDTIFFTISHVTHTGHSAGSVIINTHPFGKLTGSVTGVAKTNRHVTLDITGKYKSDTYTAEFKGIASHTAGSISGTYTITGGLTDTGSFHIGKS
jgi:hypothetical protein